MLFAKFRQDDKSLYGWMRANYHALLAELGNGRRITWRPAMRAVTELQLLDARGHSPTQDTVYRTWRRVRIEIANASAREHATPLQKDEIAPGVRGLHERVDRVMLPKQKLDIYPVRARAPLTPGDPPKVPAADDARSDVSAVNDRLEQARRVFAAIGATRTPMPKRVV